MDVRDRLGQALFLRVAGPDGPRKRERIHGREGPRWFDPGSPIARVHGDASMFVGGIRALLLQSLHPAAMRAVSEHSGYRGDMWGRLQRTSTFLAVTMLASACTRDQVVCLIIAVVFCVLMTLCGYDDVVREVGKATTESVGNALSSLGVWDHFRSLTRGSFRLQDAVWFGSIIVTSLLGTSAILSAKRA